MSLEREGPAAVVFAAVGVALCCGLPVLLGAGAAVSFLGVGLRSWILVVAGVAVVTLALVETRRRRSEQRERGVEPPGRR